ncbi:MAG: putative surface protein with fasciclin (FAS1) repeats [Psychroserpens sp.]
MAVLLATLQSEGPFAIFTPLNSAFDKLPVGTVDNLLMMENKAAL